MEQRKKKFDERKGILLLLVKYKDILTEELTEPLQVSLWESITGF
jgi:hypothetical protein